MPRATRSSRTRGVLPLAAGAAVLSSATGPAVAWLGVVRPYSGFILFGLGALLGLMVVIAGLAMALRGQKLRRYGLLSAAVGLVPVLLAALPVAMSGGAPPINDVTTDPDNPPVFVAAVNADDNKGKDLTWPTVLRDVEARHWPTLGPLVCDATPDAAYRAAVDLATARGWTLTRQQNANGERVIEAETHTAIFRFVDDVVIRVRADADGRTRIDMRSRSRVGRGDLGANASRILQFLADLKTALAAGP
ncbi:MAG: DUF1499 domain-containing protein [Planctomycetota bacterium]